MKFTGPIYRPPWEAETPLLQVTVGCAHNKCTFCTMYRDVPFSIEKPDQVEKDLKEMKGLYGKTKRLFLVNGDAFVLSHSRLKPIAEKAHQYLPHLETITMYASISNVKSKTDEELKELRALGINELWIGVETGFDEALPYLNKGFTIEDTRTQLRRLNEAGIDFYYGFMYGAAGSGKGQENARANAELINEVKPKGIAPTSFSANEGTKLESDVNSGAFVLATEREIFEEQKLTIELINAETIYYGRHIINTIPFDCLLPRDKVQALGIIDERIAAMEADYLDNVPQRHTI